ncbi:hypothetical protein IWW38_004837, partial [Coemansia aciculifera]
ARPSAEPEASGGSSNSMVAASRADASKEDSPDSLASSDSTGALTEVVSPGGDESVSVAVAPTKPKKSASKASLATMGAAENEDSAAASAKAPAKKKGAKASPKTPAAPKERKPRAKAKAKSASVAPPSETEASAAFAVSAGESGDGAVLAQSMSGANSARMSGDEALGANVAGTANSLLLPSPVAAAPFPAVGSPPVAMPQAQMMAQAMAQFNAQLASMAQANPGGRPLDIPKHITKEYLQAHPEYAALLRRHMSQVTMQMQMQQQQQGVPNMNGSSAGPMGSPQMRPSIVHQSMANMAQSMHNGQGIAGNVVPPGASPSVAAARAPTPSSLGGPVLHGNPALGSPAMRPALGPGVPNNMAAVQQQQMQQQQMQMQPTREEMNLIQQYCRLVGLQIQSVHDPRVQILISKARSGELRNMFMASLQAYAAQRQQHMAVPAAVGSGGGANPMGMSAAAAVHGGVPIQNSPAPANSLPAGATSAAATQAMGIGQSVGAGMPQTARPMQIPRDPANPQDKAMLLEMLQRQRDAQLTGGVAGAQMQ